MPAKFVVGIVFDLNIQNVLLIKKKNSPYTTNNRLFQIALSIKIVIQQSLQMKRNGMKSIMAYTAI